MTAIEKIEAEERKRERYDKQLKRCSVCGRKMEYCEAQLAHRIPKGYVDMFGPEIIHHELNTPLTCPECNSSVLLSFAANPIEAAKLIEEIKENL